MEQCAITSAELAKFQNFIFAEAGITLSAAKKELVRGRLGKRVAHYQLGSFSAYYELLRSGQHPDEVRVAVDLLTTNETYFFREMKHFDFLRAQLHPGRGLPYRVWSAACSSGEEPYSIAMVLADVLGNAPWEVVGTDISTKVLDNAAHALYTLERARHIPADYLKRFCLKGCDEFSGKLLVDRAVRARVQFHHANLNEPLPSLGMFDCIFLRNVMIYFDAPTKRQVVSRLIEHLHPGGYFIVGHSESLNGLTDRLRPLRPTIYQRPA